MSCLNCTKVCTEGYSLFQIKFNLKKEDMPKFVPVGEKVCDIIHTITKEQFEAVRFSALKTESLLRFLKTINSGEAAGKILFRAFEDLPVYELAIQKEPEKVAMFYNILPANFEYSEAAYAIVINPKFYEITNAYFHENVLAFIEKLLTFSKKISICKLSADFVIVESDDCDDIICSNLQLVKHVVDEYEPSKILRLFDLIANY